MSSTEVIDLSSSDEESNATTYRPQYSQHPSDIRLDYNMVGAYDDDDVAIIDNGLNGMPADSEDNYEDLNNCGSHTDDSLNTLDSEGRVLVNVAHPPDEPDIYLAPQIARAVKPHQIGGIRFLYDNVIESIERSNNSAGFGCILSHSMGLGKTMQVFIYLLLVLNVV
jgi:RAD54-like protein 2